MHTKTYRLKQRKYHGSVTIEAAFVLPLFFLGMVTLISVNSMFVIHMQIQDAIVEKSRELSLSYYDGHCEALSDVVASINSNLKEQSLQFSMIENGIEGLDYSNSNISSDEYIEICVCYRLKPIAGDMFRIINIPVTQKSLSHVWCGYRKGYLAEEDYEYVYITKNSNVYHRDRECSHIKLSISKVNGEMVVELRNKNGAKYYSCEICHSSINDEILYVTSEGNKYHKSISCSGLRRTVMTVKLKDVLDRRPCLRCGY